MGTEGYTELVKAIVDLSSNQQMGTHVCTELAKAVVKANGEAEQKGQCIDLQKLNLKSL